MWLLIRIPGIVSTGMLSPCVKDSSIQGKHNYKSSSAANSELIQNIIQKPQKTIDKFVKPVCLECKTTFNTLIEELFTF